MEKNKYTKGIICIIISAFCFALMNLFIRLTGDVPTMQKCFFRNFFAFIIAIISLLKSRSKILCGKENVKYLFARSLAGGLGMICNFYAIDNMAISDASMLNKLSPFFAIIFSIWVLKEKSSVKDWIAVLCAFIGALFVVKPTFDAKAVPAFAGVLGGFGAGLAYTYVRKLGTKGVSSMVVVGFFSGFTTLLLTPNLIINYAPMNKMQWMYLILTGIAASGGQIFITKAYSYAPAKEISVYDFSIVIFSALLGFMFLEQIPDYLSVIGYVIIIGTAVIKYVTSKNKYRGKE